MKTQNSKYLDPDKNKEYYSSSDGNFMPFQNCTMAHKFIPRIKWLVEKIHELDTRTHIAVGCKDGYECLTLQAMGVDCVGIDPSQDAIFEARDKAHKLGYNGRKMFLRGFAEEIPEGVSADTVSCLEVIEHVVDEHKLLKKLSKLGNYLFVSTPNAEGRHGIEDSKRNEEHVRIFNKEEFEALMSKYGKIIDSQVIDDGLCILIKCK